MANRRDKDGQGKSAGGKSGKHAKTAELWNITKGQVTWREELLLCALLRVPAGASWLVERGAHKKYAQMEFACFPEALQEHLTGYVDNGAFVVGSRIFSVRPLEEATVAPHHVKKE